MREWIWRWIWASLRWYVRRNAERAGRDQRGWIGAGAFARIWLLLSDLDRLEEELTLLLYHT